MIKLKDAVNEWMKQWVECDYCHDMCRLDIITSDNEDKPICNDCVDEDIMSHWIS